MGGGWWFGGRRRNTGAFRANEIVATRSTTRRLVTQSRFSLLCRVWRWGAGTVLYVLYGIGFVGCLILALLIAYIVLMLFFGMRQLNDEPLEDWVANNRVSLVEKKEYMFGPWNLFEKSGGQQVFEV